MVRKQGSRTPSRPSSPAIAVILALILPPLGGYLAILLALGTAPDPGAARAFLFGGVGLVSWFAGLAWYGLPGLGLRGGRPLFASIGFAVMGWVALLLFRILLVFSEELAVSSFQTFIFLLLFEAFSVQLWLYGLVFRAVADWRGGITAVFASGLLFGLISWLGFGESFQATELYFDLIFFVTWGIFYGLIRLRTGSLLGTTLVQAVQSLTAWHVLVPASEADIRLFYGLTTLAFFVFIWRLWPQRESDYRV